LNIKKLINKSSKLFKATLKTQACTMLVLPDLNMQIFLDSKVVKEMSTKKQIEEAAEVEEAVEVEVIDKTTTTTEKITTEETTEVADVVEEVAWPTMHRSSPLCDKISPPKT